MKKTVDISDPLLHRALDLAIREGVTLDALMERGLRYVVARSEQNPPFRLRDASFEGRGLHSEARDASWKRLRDLAYDGRGA